MAELLRVESLSAGYGSAVVLHDVSLSIAEGDTLALLGRNGVGKSTLIGTLAGRHHPAWRTHESRRHRAGTPALARRAAAGIGWRRRSATSSKSLTVHENLTAVERPGRGRDPGRRRGSTRCFGRLAERRGNLGNQLSGGEQQMLAVGRALAPQSAPPAARRAARGPRAPSSSRNCWPRSAASLREEGISAIIVEQHPQMILRFPTPRSCWSRAR